MQSRGTTDPSRIRFSPKLMLAWRPWVLITLALLGYATMPAYAVECPVCDEPVFYSPTQFPNIALHPNDSIVQTEMAIARSPVDPLHLIAGANASRQYYSGAGSCTKVYSQGVYVSTDGGFSWSGTDTLSGSQSLGGANDPVIAFNDAGEAFFGYITIGGDRTLVVRKSTNGGTSWDGSSTVAWSSNQPDKPHIAVDLVSDDSLRNTVYLAWRSDSVERRIGFARSVDSGRGERFSAPMTIGYAGSGVQLAVGPSGVLYAVWAYGDHLKLVKSGDGGKSWSSERVIPTEIHSFPGDRFVEPNRKNFEVKTFPSIAVDTNHLSRSSFRGRLYVAWNDVAQGAGRNDGDILVLHSDDGGVTWPDSANPIRVNDDPEIRRDQWTPHINVDYYGGVNVVFYDCRAHSDNFTTDVIVARSVDGAESFVNERVNDVSFPSCDDEETCSDQPQSSCGSGYAGHYIDITSNENFIYPCWHDNRGRKPSFKRKYLGWVAIMPISATGAPGHISTNTTWPADTCVYLDRDLTIDYGATLTIGQNARIRTAGFQDAGGGGVDADRIEIIVAGSLVLDTSGERQCFLSDSASAGAWYGIRVLPLGFADFGHGCWVSEATNAITVAANATVSEIRGCRIENTLNAGIWTSHSNVKIAHDTISGISSGYAIYLNEANPRVDSCVIDSCGEGIYAFLSSSRLRGNKIDGPGVNGINVNPFASLYEDHDSMVIVDNAVTGYYSNAHLNAGPLGHCWIDSCKFVTDTIGDRSDYGLRVGWSSNVAMRRSTISGFDGTGYYSFRSNSNLGTASQGGSNSITSTCSSCKRAAHYGNTTTQSAQGNWWGADPPDYAWFIKFDYANWLSDPPLGKAQVFVRDVGSSMPQTHIAFSNYPNPFNASTVVEFDNNRPSDVGVDIVNLLGQRVRVLHSGYLLAGLHRLEWDGKDGSGRQLASGVYFVRISAGGAIYTRKIVLLR